MNELGSTALGYGFEVLTEARLGDRPVSDGVLVFFAGRLVLGFPPVALDGRIALELETFLHQLTGTRVVNEFWHASAVAYEFRLVI